MYLYVKLDRGLLDGGVGLSLDWLVRLLGAAPLDSLVSA